jgi:Family of unknown function (DUF6483)
MIRQDYILRLVQEMVQLLARVVFLKTRREYEEALREINQALRQLGAPDGDQPIPSVDDWLALCGKHEVTASGLTNATAELLREQGEVLALQGKAADSRRSRTAALALFLESILNGRTFVSEELLQKVERLVIETADGPRPSSVWLRLVHYFEARGRYGLSEDALFAWLADGEEMARREGAAFYERRMAEDDAALEAGGLPRPEVIQGRAEFSRIAGNTAS